MTQIKLENLGNAVASMFDRFKDAQQRGLVNAAIRGHSWIISELLPTLNPPPFDTGAFRAGWNFMPTSYGAIIYNSVPHGVFINFGVEPGNVRVSGPMLEEWVERKGIASGADVPRAAWNIANHLRVVGIFTDPQYRITQRTVDEYLVDVVAKEVAIELGKVGWK